MSDFYQTGVVATFHRLGSLNIEKIESELSWYAQERPIALVLPSLYSELQGDALKGIVREIKDVKYVKEIVVTLGPANEEEFRNARQFFSALPYPVQHELRKKIFRRFREEGIEIPFPHRTVYMKEEKKWKP